MAWYDWFQTDLPCQYSQRDATDAKAYLINALGTAFIESSGKLRATHPILREWDMTGANAFLQLNGLADDIKVVQETRGIDVILGDLRDERLCLPTWHLLHSVAMFQRARAGAALEFIKSADEERPDAMVDIEGHAIPFEAKLLTRSEEEARFEMIARKIKDAIDAAGGTPAESFVRVVLKRATKAADIASVTASAMDAITSYSGTPIVKRGRECNVFVEPMPAVAGIADFRILYVLAPVPDSENMRAVRRAKKASQQLRSLPTGQESGILSIGLTDNQDGAAVFDHIARRIQTGRLRGISAVMLLKRRTHLGPPQRMNVDLLEIRRNPTAQQPLEGRLLARPSGGAALLTLIEPPTVGIRAYRFGASRGRVTDPKMAGLSLPDIRTLTLEDVN